MDNCDHVIATWDAVVACSPLHDGETILYEVTLSSLSDHVVIGPLVTDKIYFRFHDTRELSGIIDVTVTTVSKGYSGSSNVVTATAYGECTSTV